MTGYRIIAEGRVETARLGLFHLQTEPVRPTDRKVLYLGGSSHDLRLKRGFLDTEITRQAHVASFEPRGLGRSDQPAGAWTMADYAKDALAYLDAIGWDSAFVIGESFGGMTALHLAVLAPKRVEALALLSATAGGDGGSSYDISEFLEMPRDEAIERWMILQNCTLAELKANDRNAFDRLKAARLETDRQFYDPSVASGGYARLLKARRDHDAWEALNTIACPVLVMAGLLDDQAPQLAQRNMAHRLRCAEFLEFPGGHGFGFASPEPMEILCKLWFQLHEVTI
ncbi:MAG: alpha/beta hydrolase [Pseudomonadota bacterium]